MDESSYITSTNELRQIIEKCSKCQHNSSNGTFIMPFHHLTSIFLKNYPRQKNFGFILNSEKDNQKVGHWFCIIIYQKKFAILCDGLNEIKLNTEIMLVIRQFCLNNKLQFIDLSCRYQQIQSKKCGFLALGILFLSHKYSFKAFMNLKKILKTNSIETNENYLFKIMKKHFGLKFF